jgi:hypothetical protein
MSQGQAKDGLGKGQAWEVEEVDFWIFLDFQFPTVCT